MSHQTSQTDSFDRELFVSVSFPGYYYPPGNERAYEELLPECLRKEGLGQLSGTGASIGEALRNDIDFDVTDLDRALDLLRSELLRLKSPTDTFLYYTKGGVSWQETLDQDGQWKRQQLSAS